MMDVGRLIGENFEVGLGVASGQIWDRILEEHHELRLLRALAPTRTAKIVSVKVAEAIVTHRLAIMVSHTCASSCHLRRLFPWAKQRVTCRYSCGRNEVDCA